MQNEIIFADPILDTIQPIIESVEADAAVTAGDLYYLDADGTPTASSTESDGEGGTIPTAIWGIAISSATSGSPVSVLYRGDARNVWGVTAANVRKLSNVGVILR